MKAAAFVLAIVILILANLPANNTYQGFCTAAAISALPPTDSPFPVKPSGNVVRSEIPEAQTTAPVVLVPQAANCVNGRCFVPQRRGLFR